MVLSPKTILRWQCAMCVRVDLAVSRKAMTIEWLREMAPERVRAFYLAAHPLNPEDIKKLCRLQVVVVLGGGMVGGVGDGLGSGVADGAWCWCRDWCRRWWLVLESGAVSSMVVGVGVVVVVVVNGGGLRRWIGTSLVRTSSKKAVNLCF